MLSFDVCGPKKNSTNTKDSLEFGVTLIGRNICFNEDSLKTSVLNIRNNQGVEGIKDQPVYLCPKFFYNQCSVIKKFFIQFFIQF